MKMETLAVHGGYEPEATTKAVAVPVYQTTSYAFDDTQHGADLFDLKVEGNIYTRIMNPTTAVLEKRVAEMEGGVGALGLSSGMAAITDAIFTIAGSGDNIVSTHTLYGGTYNLFAHALPRLGIEVRFVDPDDLEAMKASIDDHTRLVFCETIGNPLGNVADLTALADLSHAHGLPLVVDNTVPTPVLCRPIEFGADIVIHSLTKYMGGHGTSIGGVVVDSGKFPWLDHADRFPMMSEPDASYHGVVYTDLGAAAYITRVRLIPLRNMGAALSPFNSFLVLQGIESLPLRMERHCENAQKVAEFLQGHDQVTWVQFAGLEDHPHHDRVQRYMGGRASSILSFGIKGGAEAGGRFIDALNLIVRLVNIGDAKSLACHPATTTHRQLDEASMKAAGVSPDMVRLSIGIEHIDDILEDLDQALLAAKA
ncbi:MAG: aminotransferase class I/II-fold pyridoxal phosphate-dependent enzyme [Gammaproteobacteria bacterium]|nr:aminotransferase class I/II-fold pyridoxal phosphate-dependent enzyme [Gammaproteobacteria bacterium]